VRETLPSFSFRPMVQTLSKFLGFMNLTVSHIIMSVCRLSITLADLAELNSLTHSESMNSILPEVYQNYFTANENF